MACPGQTGFLPGGAGNLRARQLRHNGDEAPPCMRWRGLAFASQPWWPIAQPPCATRRHLAALEADCSAAERREAGPASLEADCSTASRCEPAAPLVCRLLRYRLLRDTPAGRIPPSVPVARPFVRSRGFPRVEPALVVKNFYCQPSAPHKAFPRELQDSLAVHRTSVVYPLCTVAFHWPVHRLIHRTWGFLSRGRTITEAVRPCRGDSEGTRAVLALSAQRKVLHDRRSRRPCSRP